MDSKVCWSTILLLVALVEGLREYRSDYEFNEQAGGWLKFQVIPATWAEARMRCHAEGAVLASPLTECLKEEIVLFVMKQKTLYKEQGITIFTGVHATFSKGDYSTIEGVPLLKLAITWAPGEPDNYENAESCLVMMVDVNNSSMADARCDTVLPYVCYKKDVTLNMTECGTTDPEYEWKPNTGSCYKLHNRALVWSEAYMTCAAEGGYLAIINSQAEAAVVKEILNKRSTGQFQPAYPNEFTIGYRDWGHQHNFMTIHGETLDQAGYRKWASGQPNNLTHAASGDRGQFCGGVHKDGRLNDLFCNVRFAFLCEMTPHNLQYNIQPCQYYKH